MIVKVNNFFYAVALALVFSNAYCEQAPTTVTKNFGNSNFKITVECSKDLANSSKEKVILSTVENLVKEIDPTIAAKEYLDYLKTIFEKLKENPIFGSLGESKTIEEASQEMNLVMQKMMQDFSKKENVLKQSVYFAALSDEAIAEINRAMGMTMQNFMIELNAIAVEAAKQAEQNKLESEQAKSEETKQELQLAYQEKMNGFFDSFYDAIKDALSKHYKI